MRTGLWLVAVAGVAQAAPRPGHAVRVERLRRDARALDVCELNGEHATCLGPKPQPRDTVEFLDERGYQGALHVISAEQATSCADASAAVWRIQLDKGEAASWHVDADRTPLGVIGLELDPNGAHVIKNPTLDFDPATNQRDLPPDPSDLRLFGIDADGDGAVDVAFAVDESCEGRPSRAICFDVFMNQDRSFTLAHRDIIPLKCLEGM